MASHEDRRIQNTRLKLRQSLFQLMREIPMHEITVTDLCKRAGVNRNTFYTHYKNPQALLSEFEEGLIREYEASIEGALQSGSAAELIFGVCESIARNHDLCSSLFFRYGDKMFLERTLNLAHERIVSKWKQLGLSEKMINRLYTFISHGSAAVIRMWIESGMADDASEVAAFIEQASSGSIATCLAKPAGSAPAL